MEILERHHSTAVGIPHMHILDSYETCLAEMPTASPQILTNINNCDAKL
jgi:hypothetical protein